MTKAEVSSPCGWMADRSGSYLALVPVPQPWWARLTERAGLPPEAQLSLEPWSLGICDRECSRRPLAVCGGRTRQEACAFSVVRDGGGEACAAVWSPPPPPSTFSVLLPSEHRFLKCSRSLVCCLRVPPITGNKIRALGGWRLGSSSYYVLNATDFV